MNESAGLHDQLLATKFFIPSFPHALILRPRLIELLTKKGLECKLTLVSAPAGFGKTTLLSNWIHSRPSERARIAWVSLDEGDNEPALFWQYVLSALDRALPGLCAELVIYLQTQQAPPLRSVLQTLLNRLAAQPEQFLLILDDYHLLTEQAIHISLTYLVEHLPPQLRVILTTRADPPLPFSLLRARGQLLELRTDDLRCTPEEVVTFLKQIARIQLSEDVVESVASRTEGWLVGLQLVAPSLQGRTSPGKLLEEVEEVSGSQRYIFDYLIEEVFGRQSAAVQTFLLQTSILTQLSAPLCDAVLEQSGSQQMLEQLERANLFLVSLDGQRHWYRYHALFAEALQHRLEQTQPAVVPGLHSRASRWYARAGRLDEALSHAIAAQDWPWAADLIEQVYPRIWGNSEHARLRRWLEQLPPEVLRSRPRLCLASAKTLFMGASYTTLERWLDDAETALQGTLRTPANGPAEAEVPLSSAQDERENLLGEIAAQRAVITGYYLGQGHATLTFCGDALAHLSQENLLARAEVAYAQSLAYYSSGDIVAAIQSIRKATALAQAGEDTSSTIIYLSRTAYSLLLHGKLHEVVQVARQATLLGATPAGLPHAMLCWAYIFQADALREWNRLDEALELALQSVRLSEQTETTVALYLGYTLLMRISLARKDMDAARLAFRKAEEGLQKTYSTYRRDAYLIVHWMQFWLASGEQDRIRNWLQEIEQPGSVDTAVHAPLVHERQEVARVRMMLARQMPAEALALLESLLGRAEQQERWSHVIEMKILQALAHALRNEEQEALTALAQAIHLAEPEGYIRAFVDEGAAMATLLSRLRDRERVQGPTPYLDTLLAAFSSARRKHQPFPPGQEEPRGSLREQPLIEPLSERELEVLQLIARGDSNQEIADQLVITLDTVKRHVTHIFEKLGVHNRVQAVARARALSLLSNEP
jgi:LuxR family transcriptional regulator, maltose regulon positive regulatory protein